MVVSVEAALDRSRVRAGDQIVCRVVFSGEGNVNWSAAQAFGHAIVPHQSPLYERVLAAAPASAASGPAAAPSSSALPDYAQPPSSNARTVFHTPPELLACNAPKLPVTHTFTVRLPATVPPSYRGWPLTTRYAIAITAQSGDPSQPTVTCKLPFTILPPPPERDTPPPPFSVFNARTAAEENVAVMTLAGSAAPSTSLSAYFDFAKADVDCHQVALQLVLTEAAEGTERSTTHWEWAEYTRHESATHVDVFLPPGPPSMSTGLVDVSWALHVQFHTSADVLDWRLPLIVADPHDPDSTVGSASTASMETPL